jgi:hypothetical protein
LHSVAHNSDHTQKSPQFFTISPVPRRNKIAKIQYPEVY